MIPNLFIISQSGEVLIEKQWFGKVKRTVCDLFWEYVAKEISKYDVLPVISTPKFHLIHTCRNDVFFLSVLNTDTSPAYVLSAHQRIMDVMSEYFKGVSENLVRENFYLTYQILDEMFDGGFGYTTDTNILKSLINPPSVTSKLLNALGSSPTSLKENSLQSRIPWRQNNVRYVNNAIYFDIMENIDGILDCNGIITTASIYGEVKCRCQLSDVPDLTLSLSKNIDVTNVSLHRCVRLAKFEKERVLSFIPPDGDFTLCTYKSTNSVAIPVYIRPNFTWTKDSCKFSITFGDKNDSNPATEIVVILPIPKAASATFVHTNCGQARVDQLSQTCRWEISQFPKDIIPTLDGSFTLNTTLPAEERPVMRVQFVKKKFSASGINVEGLVVKNVNYSPVRGVRVITQAGKLQVRTQ